MINTVMHMFFAICTGETARYVLESGSMPDSTESTRSGPATSREDTVFFNAK